MELHGRTGMARVCWNHNLNLHRTAKILCHALARLGLPISPHVGSHGFHLRIMLNVAYGIVELDQGFFDQLSSNPRRRTPTVGDVEMLTAARRAAPVYKIFMAARGPRVRASRFAKINWPELAWCIRRIVDQNYVERRARWRGNCHRKAARLSEPHQPTIDPAE